MENESEIVCQDCGVTFVFKARHDKGRSAEPPTRCSLCRAEQRRPANDAQPKYTGDPNEYRSPMACDFPEPRRPRRNGPRRRPEDGANPTASATEGQPQGRRHRRRRPMYTGVCAKCGATAHVPFQPSKFQEVLCRACFQDKRGLSRPASEPDGQ